MDAIRSEPLASDLGQETCLVWWCDKARNWAVELYFTEGERTQTRRIPWWWCAAHKGFSSSPK